MISRAAERDRFSRSHEEPFQRAFSVKLEVAGGVVEPHQKVVAAKLQAQPARRRRRIDCQGGLGARGAEEALLRGPAIGEIQRARSVDEADERIELAAYGARQQAARCARGRRRTDAARAIIGGSLHTEVAHDLVELRLRRASGIRAATQPCGTGRVANG